MPHIVGLQASDDVEILVPGKDVISLVELGKRFRGQCEPSRYDIRVSDVDGHQVLNRPILWWCGTSSNASEASSDWSKAFLDFERASALRRDSQFELAEHLWTETAARFLQIGAFGYALRSYVSAAYCAIRHNRLRRAEELLDTAVNATKPDLGDLDQALLWHQKANLGLYLSDFRHAREALSKAEMLSPKSKLLSTAFILFLQQRAASKAGAHQLALQYEDVRGFHSSFEIALARISVLWVKIRAMEAGAIPWDMSGVRDATVAVVTRFEELGHPVEAGEAFMNLAFAESLAGEYNAARDSWTRAIRLNPVLATQPFGALLRGRLAEQGRSWVEAGSAYREVVDRGLEDQNPDYVWQAHHGLARVAEAQDERAAARLAYEAALRIRRDTMLGAPLRFGRSTFAADRAEVVADAVALFLSQGDEDAAFRVLDEESGRTLRDLESRLRVSRLEGQARTTYLERLGRYRRLKEDYAELRRAEPEGMKAVAAALQRQKALRAEMDEAFEAAYEALEAGGTTQVEGVSRKELQDVLQEDEALLLVAELKGRAFRFAVTSTTAAYQQAAPEDPISSSVAALLRGRRHVYGVGPWPKDLSLSPDTSRSDLPFASLLTRTPLAPRGEALVLSNPSGDLPFASQEGAWVSQRLKARRLDGAEADMTRVLAGLESARHLHFTGHGVGSAADAWSAHLVLADEQQLSLEDLVALRPKVGTVVLSGCETGKGTQLSQQEKMSLADAFLISGAKWVLASDALVPDKETQAFVQAFYESGGLDDPAKTLRTLQAQSEGPLQAVAQAFRLHGHRR